VFGVWNISVDPDEPGGWTAPEVIPSVSSSGRRVALTGSGTTMSESGEGGVEDVGVIEKPAASGVDRSILRVGEEIIEIGLVKSKSLRGTEPLLRPSTGVSGAETHGTTFVTTFDRKDLDGAFAIEDAVAEDNAAAEAPALRR